MCQGAELHCVKLRPAVKLGNEGCVMLVLARYEGCVMPVLARYEGCVMLVLARYVLKT